MQVGGSIRRLTGACCHFYSVSNKNNMSDSLSPSGERFEDELNESELDMLQNSSRRELDEFSEKQFRLQSRRNTKSRLVEDQVLAYSTLILYETHEMRMRHYQATEMTTEDYYACVLACDKARTEEVSRLELAHQAACYRNFQTNEIRYQIAMRYFKSKNSMVYDVR